MREYDIKGKCNLLNEETRIDCDITKKKKKRKKKRKKRKKKSKGRASKAVLKTQVCKQTKVAIKVVLS